MKIEKRYLFLGDCHGDLAFAESAAVRARQYNATILQAGDWGFLWPGNDQLQDLSDMLVGLGVVLHFVDGNHDEHPRLKKLGGRVRLRGVEIAKNVIYQPRGSIHEDEDGTRFLFLGGAPSIDQAGRIEGESWWPEETITNDEFDLAMSAEGPIHVLVTHDAPTLPPGFSPKGSLRYQYAQELSMERVDALIRHHRPMLHVHGHWHTRATTIRGSTRVEALASNLQRFDEAFLLWNRSARL